MFFLTIGNKIIPEVGLAPNVVINEEISIESLKPEIFLEISKMEFLQPE